MTPSSDRRAGIYGGTFDPIHRGHVAVAEQSAKLLGLPSLLVVPAGRPPHRQSPEASAEDRLAMVELALGDRPRLRASDIEVRRPGPSYAVDTLRELGRADPATHWTLLLGWDAAREFGTWHSAPEIVSLADVVVFNRSGQESPTRDGLLAAGLPPETRVLEVDSPELSADSIRERLAAGEDPAADLHPAVWDYIRTHHLYGA
ncbi:MAG TPA: nicotinate (nicotinamide) nucleotide adenylyltransferase [Candidatus Dormibacteraeota bacterium]|nr:nicotinate (nicotinamide) nucleotide adenylyltransferase [Candidatus Dormibacteraeota bacterium]